MYSLLQEKCMFQIFAIPELIWIGMFLGYYGRGMKTLMKMVFIYLFDYYGSRPANLNEMVFLRFCEKRDNKARRLIPTKKSNYCFSFSI